MGLDIYLEKYDDFNKTKELEEKFRIGETEIWEGNDDDENYKLLTEEQKEQYREKVKNFAESLGLDKWGSDKKGRETIELDSVKFPDHYFKIGYFRSSYNEGGIQRILRNLNLPTLDYIFDRENDEYEFQPNWNLALERVREVREKLSQAGNYRCFSASANIFASDNTIKSEGDAIKTFLEEVNRESRSDYNYSNAKGDFFIHEPLKVLALIPGTNKILRERDCVYVITESDNTWYINALDIVEETIEYVLSRENKEQYYLHWSG
jgi:hypothetical protein